MLNQKMQLANPLGSCLWVFTVLQICLPAFPKIWLTQSLAVSPFTYETRGRIKETGSLFWHQSALRQCKTNSKVITIADERTEGIPGGLSEPSQDFKYTKFLKSTSRTSTFICFNTFLVVFVLIQVGSLKFQATVTLMFWLFSDSLQIPEKRE